MENEHKRLPAQINASSLVPAATPNITLGSLQTDLKSCDVNENFILINDIGLDVRPYVELNYRERATRMNSKLSISHQGRLHRKIEITGKRPTDILKEESESWRAFKSELRFIATNICHWHSHPSIIRYHGVAILKEEEGGCGPYLLSERVEWNLLSLLEDGSEEAYLSQQFKVSIVHDIASGLSFLHSCRPRAIVHAALNSSSVLIDNHRNAKLADFFHAGYAGDPFTIASKSHKLPKCNSEMKLHTSFDMLCLGVIVKAIDADVKNRERVPEERNILKKFYALCDSENRPPQDLTACEVSRRTAAYLENPNQSPAPPQQQETQQPQQQLSRMRRMARFIEDKFVRVFAPEGEDQDVADDFDRDLFGKSGRH